MRRKRRTAARAWPLLAPVAADAVVMDRALRLARASGRAGEVPIGAVVVMRGHVVGAGRNRPIAARDPSAHAEIVALRRAARAAGNYRLSGAALYVTLEPCLMCLGAMIHARVARLVYGAADARVGAVRLLRRGRIEGLNHRFAVTAGVRESECARLLREFFASRRHGGAARANGPSGRRIRRPGRRNGVAVPAGTGRRARTP